MFAEAENVLLKAANAKLEEESRRLREELREQGIDPDAE